LTAVKSTSFCAGLADGEVGAELGFVGFPQADNMVANRIKGIIFLNILFLHFWSVRGISTWPWNAPDDFYRLLSDLIIKISRHENKTTGSVKNEQLATQSCACVQTKLIREYVHDFETSKLPM
jgi:hypothetical protein